MQLRNFRTRCMASASISYLPSPSAIAPTGHSPSHVPHIIHSSLILYAICFSSLEIIFNAFISTIILIQVCIFCNYFILPSSKAHNTYLQLLRPDNCKPHTFQWFLHLGIRPDCLWYLRRLTPVLRYLVFRNRYTRSYHKLLPDCTENQSTYARFLHFRSPLW